MGHMKVGSATVLPTQSLLLGALIDHRGLRLLLLVVVPAFFGHCAYSFRSGLTDNHFTLDWPIGFHPFEDSPLFRTAFVLKLQLQSRNRLL